MHTNKYYTLLFIDLDLKMVHVLLDVAQCYLLIRCELQSQFAGSEDTVLLSASVTNLSFTAR